MGRGNTGEPEKTGEAGGEVGRLEEVQVEGQKITTNPGPGVN